MNQLRQISEAPWVMIPHLSDTLDWALINQLITQKKDKVIRQKNITYVLHFYTLPFLSKSCQGSVPGLVLSLE